MLKISPIYFGPIRPPNHHPAQKGKSQTSLCARSSGHVNLGEEMSQPIPVDILSDSDSDSDSDSADNRRLNFNDDTVDLITPPPAPQPKKKRRIETFSNPSRSNVLIIDDDDPTPCKQKPSSMGPTSSSTPSFVAETPFSDASIVKCSRRKSSFSGKFTFPVMLMYFSALYVGSRNLNSG